LTRIGKTVYPVAVSRAVPAASREVTAAFNFIGERSAQRKNGVSILLSTTTTTLCLISLADLIACYGRKMTNSIAKS
jgi:hypothetical protein